MTLIEPIGIHSHLLKKQFTVGGSQSAAKLLKTFLRAANFFRYISWVSYYEREWDKYSAGVRTGNSDPR